MRRSRSEADYDDYVVKKVVAVSSEPHHNKMLAACEKRGVLVWWPGRTPFVL